MKIGIYNPRVGISRSGGTETFLREIMKRLQEDHDIVLYCGEGKLLDEIKNLSVEIRQIPFIEKESRLSDLLTRFTPILPAEVESFSMYLYAKRRGIFDEIDGTVDVISTHYYLDNILVSRSVSAPTLFRIPGIKHPSPRWKAMVELANPNSYLANSEATADRLRNWLDLDVDGVVYAGVDLDQFCSDADLAFDSERVSILFVGRIDEGKGLRELVEAQSRLGDKTRLYLVGDGTLKTELRRKVRDLGIEDSVEFVGAIPHDEIHRYYRSSDIFCLPSYHESLGLVNLEAMASGTPVVSTNIDAIEEYLHDGENGIVVPPGDIDALTDALDRLVSDQSLQDRFASAGQETATHFGWDAQATEIEKHYERLGSRRLDQ